MESIFLILSGVILVAGILYWFWSHIQLTQKKVQLLENAVFELRGLLANSPACAKPPAAAATATADANVASGSAYKDVDDGDWDADVDDGAGVGAGAGAGTGVGVGVGADGDRETSMQGTSLEALGITVEKVSDDLMPGGRIHVDEASPVAEESNFRELFVGNNNNNSSSAHSPEALDSMPVKELRRLAEQRGIHGVADMRKKEILAALRGQIQPQQSVLDLDRLEHNGGMDAEVETLE